VAGAAGESEDIDGVSPGGNVPPVMEPAPAIEPIGPGQQREVLDMTEHYLALADSVFEFSFERIPVLFDLRGTSAGMFRIKGETREIRYNPWIFAKYFEDNLRDTVPHEVAHYIVHAVYGERRIKPHGWQWTQVMEYFDADPAVTFSQDLSGIPQRRQRTHSYRCSCREHKLSTTRHNRVQRRKGEYQCLYCHDVLRYSAVLQDAY
jgi:SprT protein